MSPNVRAATPDDLPALAELASRSRRQYTAWEPQYFRAAADADADQQRRIAGLLDSGDAVARVATSDDDVVGCAIAVRQPRHWFVEQIAAADEGWWSDAMLELLRSVGERPAVAAAPAKDIRQIGCFNTLGLRRRSAYWRLPLTGAGEGRDGVAAAVPAPARLPDPPPHTFSTVDPAAATVLGDGDDGFAVLASAHEASAGYDPGGSTGLVERVTGGRRGELVDAATADAAARGDVQLVVVCSDDDPVLEDALVDRGFARVVEVYSWPARMLA